MHRKSPESPWIPARPKAKLKRVPNRRMESPGLCPRAQLGPEQFRGGKLFRAAGLARGSHLLLLFLRTQTVGLP